MPFPKAWKIIILYNSFPCSSVITVLYGFFHMDIVVSITKCIDRLCWFIAVMFETRNKLSLIG